MAVRIPIVTVFDSKGLKQAQYQLNKVRGNFQNLGRNFALAGAAFAGAAAVIAKSAQDLARIEKINAQTEAVLKSMGNSAGVTAQHIQDLAGNLERLTASEAETIQEGANLLLTFRNIQNQVGANNDIFDQAVTMSVDLARAMGTTASGEAIRLGKALNDPTKGVAALTRVGVSFTEQQKEQIKALQESGDLLGAQKIILGELQAQFGGSGQAYAATFAGQVELLNHELGALGEEATMVVMPALQSMVASLRELAPEVGEKLSAAIASVDWKAFTEGIVNAITFLVQNAETIMRVVTAMFLLNTAYNAGRVAIGLYNAAAVFLNTTLKSTTALANGLRTALFLGGVTLAVGYVIDSYRKLKTAIENTNSSLSAFDTEVLSVSKAAGEINPIVKLWNNLTNAILKAVTAKNRFDGSGPKPTIGTGFGGSDVNSWRAALPPKTLDPYAGMGGSGGGGSSAKQVQDAVKKTAQTFAEAVKQLAVTQAAKLKKTIDFYIAKFPISKEWKELGSKTGNEIVKGLHASLKSMRGFAGAFTPTTLRGVVNTIIRPIYKAVEALQKRFVERGEFQKSIRENIMGMFDFTEAKNGIDSIIKRFKDQVEQSRKFKENLAELQKLGLRSDLFRKIAEGSDFAAAAELVKGGLGAVTEINNLYTQLEGFSDEIATVTGNQLYNLGINAATGYIRTLEEGFDGLKAYADRAVRTRILSTARQELQEILDAGGLTPERFRSVTDQLEKIKREQAQLKSTKPAIDYRFQMELDKYIAEGGALNDSIRAQFAYSQLSNREKLDFRRQSGINISINGGINTSAQIGQAVIDAIRAYERANGRAF